MEWQNYTGPVSADISVGIKSIGRSIGSRYAAMDWAWTRSATFEFNIENDYWEVELPLLSTLIERADLAEADSFSLCVQIGTPICSKPTFQFPHQLIVQTSMTDSLAGLIDSTTGDVRFVCLEHSAAPLSPMDDEGISGRMLSKMRTLSRKRILYAHSDVLKARGEYFAALLMGGFSESEIKRRGDSKHTTILVDDADFETVYWVLKFIYTYQITFADDDNVRLLTDRCHLNNGEVAKMLGSAPAYLGENEWDYRRLPMIEEEPEDNVSDFEHDGKTTKMFSEPDPHHHPTTAPGPGSALAIFKLSHRYRIEVLQNLAMEHILSRLTPGNCMPLL